MKKCVSQKRTGYTKRVVLTPRLPGSLSNYDDDHNDDFKKTIGLMVKTTALHVITLFSTFL